MCVVVFTSNKLQYIKVHLVLRTHNDTVIIMITGYVEKYMFRIQFPISFVRSFVKFYFNFFFSLSLIVGPSHFSSYCFFFVHFSSLDLCRFCPPHPNPPFYQLNPPIRPYTHTHTHKLFHAHTKCASNDRYK